MSDISRHDVGYTWRKGNMFRNRWQLPGRTGEQVGVMDAHAAFTRFTFAWAGGTIMMARPGRTASQLHVTDLQTQRLLATFQPNTYDPGAVLEAHTNGQTYTFGKVADNGPLQQNDAWHDASRKALMIIHDLGGFSRA